MIHLRHFILKQQLPLNDIYILTNPLILHRDNRLEKVIIVMESYRSVCWSALSQTPHWPTFTRDIHPMLSQCWASVEDDGPTLKPHCVNAPAFAVRGCFWFLKYTWIEMSELFRFGRIVDDLTSGSECSYPPYTC